MKRPERTKRNGYNLSGLVFGLALFCVTGNGCAKGVYCCLGNVVLLGDGVV